MTKDQIETIFQAHTAVMPVEVLNASLPVLQKSRPRIFDGTFGRGGHFQIFLNQNPSAEVVAFDQDLQAITQAQFKFESQIKSGQLRLFHQNFSAFALDEAQNLGPFDLIFMDLGVSSPQLDTADRGFSFYQDGPLDMRMNQTAVRKASDVLNTFSEEDLIEIFKKYGENYSPFRVVYKILKYREIKPFERTLEFADLVEKTDGWRKKGFHPATQYFMALRLFVNQELQNLQLGLDRLIPALSPSGRFVVLTFHSLEDRIVKNAFKSCPEWGQPLFKKVMIPTDEEVRQNPRARSAKLRVFEREIPVEPTVDSPPAKTLSKYAQKLQARSED